MTELLSPGVFIQEVDFGPQPIEGVSTSTAGFVGEAERGPVSGPPTLVTSFPDYQRAFGGLEPTKDLAYAVRGFFDNGGKRAFISRIIGANNDAASVVVENGYDVALLAPVPQGAPFVLRVASVVGVQEGESVQIINSDGTPISGTSVFTISVINATAGTITITGTAPTTLRPTSHAVRYVNTGTAASAVIELVARDPGAFGNRARVRLVPIYLANATITGLAAPVGTDKAFIVSAILPFAPNQIVEFEAAGASPRDRAYVTVTSVDAAASKIVVADPGTFAIGDSVRVTGYRLEVFFDGALVETIDRISSDTAATDGIVEKLVQESQWVRVQGTPALSIEGVALTTSTAVFPLFVAGQPVPLTVGTDGDPPGAADVIGQDTEPRTGLKALEAQEGINIIAAPGFSQSLPTPADAQSVNGELISQAERLQDRFAVLESDDDSSVQNVLSQRGLFNSRYAAFYHPWLRVFDTVTRTVIDKPPSGHVVGAYARTDNERGVFKAPANVTLRGINGFTQEIPTGEQDLFNPNGVNILRRFDGLGLVIWGARTISSETLWKYVPVRRLFIFLEQSIVRGTRFAVFEPNDPRLWARLRDAVTNFLTSQWRAGALFGNKPEEAFFVKVDETTTTQDDRDNGRVNIVVGIAPVKPAEFIVFQIGQAPQSVIIAEQS
jgi:uncharacterized protein